MDETPEAQPEILAALGAAVRDRRRELGLAQDVLAARANINRTYLSDVEAGKRNIGVLNIEKLAQALELRPWELLKRADTGP